MSNTENQDKIIKIIQDRGEEIYTKQIFIGLIADYFPNDDLGRLLKIVITYKGALYVLKLKQYKGDELQINYLKILDKLKYKTFIQKEILAHAIDLLCFGLGLNIKSYLVTKPTQIHTKTTQLIQTQMPPTLPVTNNPTPTPTPPPGIKTPKTKLVTNTPKLTTNTPKSKPLPAPVDSIDNYKIVDGVLIKFIGKSTDLTIPKTVKEIGEDAFFCCHKITKVFIPESVKIIGVNAFDGCTSLDQITIPNSVIKIGDYAFRGCKSLSKVDINNSTEVIGNGAFMDCISLNLINLPNSVMIICDNAFEGCESLNKINLPESVSVIGKNAFKNCKSLNQVTIPSSVTEIGEEGFKNCKSLNQATKNRLAQLEYTNF